MASALAVRSRILPAQWHSRIRKSRSVMEQRWVGHILEADEVTWARGCGRHATLCFPRTKHILRAQRPKGRCSES